MSARRATGLLVVTAFVSLAWVGTAHAQATTKPFEPTAGQARFINDLDGFARGLPQSG